MQPSEEKCRRIEQNIIFHSQNNECIVRTVTVHGLPADVLDRALFVYDVTEMFARLKKVLLQLFLGYTDHICQVYRLGYWVVKQEAATFGEISTETFPSRVVLCLLRSS